MNRPRPTNFEQLIEDLEEYEPLAIDKAVEILQRINQWCDAYPENIFIPMTTEDWKNHHQVLKEANRSGSSAAADSMRHVIHGIKKVLDT